MKSATTCLTSVFLTVLLVSTTGLTQENFFDSNGVRIRYVDQGSGDPIVLIHGHGRSLSSWIDSGVLPSLAANYRVVAFDVRGHGKSGKPHDVMAYKQDMVLDVVRLLDHLGLRQAHIIGYSMGARITSELLTLHPERFLSAVISGTAGQWRWTREDGERSELEASEFERECVSRSQLLRLAPVNGPKPSADEIKSLSAACMADPNQDRFALAALARARQYWTITPAQVAAVRVPTLGVVGSLDGNLKDFEELKRLRPDVKVVVIEGATHSGDRGASRRPEFIGAVREFISSIRAPSR